MTRFIDPAGGRLEITMLDKRTGCPWEYDFFEVSGLRYNEGADAYQVDDVLYLVDYAEDYMHGRGDFAGERPGADQSTLVYRCSIGPAGIAPDKKA